MKCLLISGAANTGKTTIIKKIVNDFLKNKQNFNFVSLVKNENINKKYNENDNLIKELVEENIKKYIDESNNNKEDYFCIAENKKKKIKIIISTASDTEAIIDNFKKYYDKNKENYSFIIAPIRNIESKGLRKKILEIFKININDINNNGDIVEMPLAKVCGNSKYKETKQWYFDTVFSLIKRILQQNPFNINNIHEF